MVRGQNRRSAPQNKVPEEVLVNRIIASSELADFKPYYYEENETGGTLQAMRFIAAQHFLIAWQQGKVPTGWKRPRRMDDFKELYGDDVVNRAKERVKQHHAEIAAREKARLSCLHAGDVDSANKLPRSDATEFEQDAAEALHSLVSHASTNDIGFVETSVAMPLGRGATNLNRNEIAAFRKEVEQELEERNRQENAAASSSGGDASGESTAADPTAGKSRAWLMAMERKKKVEQEQQEKAEKEAAESALAKDRSRSEKQKLERLEELDRERREQARKKEAGAGSAPWASASFMHGQAKAQAGDSSDDSDDSSSEASDSSDEKAAPVTVVSTPASKAKQSEEASCDDTKAPAQAWFSVLKSQKDGSAQDASASEKQETEAVATDAAEAEKQEHIPVSLYGGLLKSSKDVEERSAQGSNSAKATDREDNVAAVSTWRSALRSTKKLPETDAATENKADFEAAKQNDDEPPVSAWQRTLQSAKKMPNLDGATEKKADTTLSKQSADEDPPVQGWRRNLQSAKKLPSLDAGAAETNSRNLAKENTEEKTPMFAWRNALSSSKKLPSSDGAEGADRAPAKENTDESSATPAWRSALRSAEKLPDTDDSEAARNSTETVDKSAKKVDDEDGPPGGFAWRSVLKSTRNVIASDRATGTGASEKSSESNVTEPPAVPLWKAARDRNSLESTKARDSTPPKSATLGEDSDHGKSSTTSPWRSVLKSSNDTMAEAGNERSAQEKQKDKEKEKEKEKIVQSTSTDAGESEPAVEGSAWRTMLKPSSNRSSMQNPPANAQRASTPSQSTLTREDKGSERVSTPSWFTSTSIGEKPQQARDNDSDAADLSALREENKKLNAAIEKLSASLASVMERLDALERRR
mmetsp:Transcript_13622/g.36569  ORF Transcript_13622/g.36569 Transcript_13622/m.36569 type:complete len:872 (+) Transcript_13622:160-2775(+)